MSNGDERLRAVLGEYSTFLRDKELVLLSKLNRNHMENWSW